MKKHTFILSDQSVNSYGFIVLTAGILLEYFKKNPVMLFNHDSNKIIGKWDNLRVEDGLLKADAYFDDTDTDAMALYNKVEKGMLNGVSIGFQILKAKMGDDDVPVVTECLLYEASLTAIPSNMNALRLYDTNGTLLKSDDVLTFLNTKTTPNFEIQNDMKKLQFFIAALNLAATATEDDILTAVQKLSSEKADADAKLADLQTKLTAAEKLASDAEEAKINTLVDGAVKEGKLTADKKDQFVKLAKTDFETTKSVIDGLPVRKSLSSTLEGGKSTGDKYADWTFDKFHREAPKELARIKAEEPERYKELFNARFSK